jgi:hypothetical protein
MPISVQCPACNLAYQAPEQFAGRTVKCKECKAEFKIPGLPSPSPKPAAVRVPAEAPPKKVAPTFKGVPQATSSRPESAPRKATTSPTKRAPVDPFALDGGDPFADEAEDDDSAMFSSPSPATRKTRRRITAGDIDRAGRITTMYVRLLLIYDLTVIVGVMGMVIYAAINLDPIFPFAYRANLVLFGFLLCAVGAAVAVATWLWVMHGSWAGRAFFIQLTMFTPLGFYLAIDQGWTLLPLILIGVRMGLHWIGVLLLTCYPGMKGYFRGEAAA